MPRLQNPYIQYHDANGNPYAGGRLFFYEAGTNTLKLVYATDDTSTPIANPQTLNANGSVPAVFYSGFARVVLLDKDNQQVFDIDNVGVEQGALNYRGQLDVSAGNSALPATPFSGDLYVIGIGGTITVSVAGAAPTPTVVSAGKQIIYNGVTEQWDLIPSTTTASAVTYSNTTSGLSAADVQGAIDEVAATAGGAAQKSANLSDLQSVATARTNLGLGTSATRNVGTTANTVAAGDDSRITGAAQKSANLSDLTSVSTARTNLGLGTAATASVTTSPTDTTSGSVLRAGDAYSATSVNYHNGRPNAFVSNIASNVTVSRQAPFAIYSVSTAGASRNVTLSDTGWNSDDIIVFSKPYVTNAMTLTRSGTEFFILPDGTTDSAVEIPAGLKGQVTLSRFATGFVVSVLG